MPYSELKDIPQQTATILFLVAVWASIMHFINKKRWKGGLMTALGWMAHDFFVSNGVTILTFFILIGFGANEVLAIGLAGFAGHEGTRASSIIILAVLEKFGVKQTFSHFEQMEKEK